MPMKGSGHRFSHTNAHVVSLETFADKRNVIRIGDIITTAI